MTIMSSPKKQRCTGTELKQMDKSEDDKRQKCYFCLGVIMGKPYTFQREHIRKDFCGVICYEQWDEYMDSLESATKGYAMGSMNYHYKYFNDDND